MTNEQLIEKFNPLNGPNLTAEDFETMRTLTDEQIEVLANAYPNQPNRKAYIRLFDKNVAANKQVYNLSTWQNLRNLRKFNAKKNLVAYDFFSIKGAVSQPVKSTGAIPGAKSPKKVVVDMTAKQAADELANSVNKSTEPGGDTKAAKTSKATPGAKKGGKNQQAATPAPVVDNAGISIQEPGASPDTEFTDGQGE